LLNSLIIAKLLSVVTKKILMIDDDKDHLSLCKLILEKEGHEVVTFSDDHEFLNSAVSIRPDMIFVDHYMGKSLGTEIVKKIRSHQATKNIPVIYFSSCADIINKAKEAGADRYLEKPFIINSLIEMANSFSL
jgi:DNA-binding response OmpR family regulator